MTKAGLGKSAEARIECWRARIAEQKRSGMSVGRFARNSKSPSSPSMSGGNDSGSRRQSDLRWWNAEQQRRAFSKPSRHAPHQGRRGLHTAEIRSPRHKEQPCTTASPRDSPHDSSQLCGRPSASGRRCDSDSLLPWSRLGQHNQPLHHHEPPNETAGARRILEAGRSRANCYPEMAALAEAARLPPNPVTLSGAPTRQAPVKRLIQYILRKSSG